MSKYTDYLDREFRAFRARYGLPIAKALEPFTVAVEIARIEGRPAWDELYVPAPDFAALERPDRSSW